MEPNTRAVLTPPPLPAAVVAAYFLDRAADLGEFLSPMKLQKLVYIAHGWHLAIVGRPLIQESVHAWQYGPVVESLYHTMKTFGGGAIDRDEALTLMHQRAGSDFEFGMQALQSELYTDTLGLLDQVWEKYRRFSAVELSAMTHRPDTPWSQVRKRSSGPRGGGLIDDEQMKQYYLELASEPAS